MYLVFGTINALTCLYYILTSVYTAPKWGTEMPGVQLGKVYIASL